MAVFSFSYFRRKFKKVNISFRRLRDLRIAMTRRRQQTRTKLHYEPRIIIYVLLYYYTDTYNKCIQISVSICRG